MADSALNDRSGFVLEEYRLNVVGVVQCRRDCMRAVVACLAEYTAMSDRIAEQSVGLFVLVSADVMAIVATRFL